MQTVFAQLPWTQFLSSSILYGLLQKEWREEKIMHAPGNCSTCIYCICLIPPLQTSFPLLLPGRVWVHIPSLPSTLVVQDSKEPG